MEANSNPWKRKKKRSLVQCVKKKFKNENVVAQGSYLDQDTHDYFLGVFEHSRQEFENDEEKRVFVENVFAQTAGHEVDYSKNQLVSRVLEGLFSFAGDETLQRFTAAFGDNLRLVCVHSYASHVLEKLVCVCANRVHEIERESSNGSSTTYQTSACFAFVIKVSKFLVNNLDEFVSNNYANHVLRATISCLANILPANHREKGKNSKFTFEINPAERDLKIEKMNKQSEFDPPEFVEILIDIANRILNSPSFVDFPRDTLMSALLQTILLSLYNVRKNKVMKSISKKLMATTYIDDSNSNQLPAVLESQPPLRLLEIVLDVSNEKLFRKIYEQCFAGRLAMLAKGRTTCFTLGKLVQRCDDKAKFLEMYAEITEGDTLREIAGSPAPLLLATVANACRRLDAMQKEFVKDISKALDVKSSDLVPALLKMEAKFVTPVFNKKPTVSFAGCVILQELLRFKKRNKIVKGILAMENDELTRLFSDPRGSHIADAFFSSDSCTDEDLELMINKLKGSFSSLSGSRHGSFAITAFWKRCPPLALKIKVIEELAKSSVDNTSSKVIASQVGLETYLSDRKFWAEAQKNQEKARKAFATL